MIRSIVAILCGFISLTAIAGGIALVSGAEASRYSTDLLLGTPFSDYTVPGLILALVVGGSAALAAVLTLIRHRAAAVAAVTAGITMMGWMVGEFLLLPAQAHSWIEAGYFALGAVIAVLGSRMSPHENPRFA